MHGKINQMIHEWFAKLIMNFMESQNYVTSDNQKRCELLARSYAASLFSGVRECLVNKEIDKDELVQVVRIYFRNCLTMIDHNFVQLEVK